MIRDSTENSCLCLHASCAENIIHDRLHASMFHHLLRRWRAHVTVGVDRPWIRCCRTGRGGNSSGGGGSGCGRISTIFSEVHGKQYTLAGEAPICNGALFQDFGYTASTPASKAILDGTYVAPADLDSATKELFAEIAAIRQQFRKILFQ